MGAGGRTLREEWSDGAHAHLGTGRIVANWPGYMREYAERVRVLDPSEFSLASPDGT